MVECGPRVLESCAPLVWGRRLAVNARHLILYDGDCGLCLRSVWFVARFDPGGVFTFAPLGGVTATAALAHVPADEVTETLVLCEGRRVFGRSTAFVRIVRRLSFPANLLAVVVIVPRPLRDAVYALVAGHRRPMFGRADACPPRPREWRERFLP